MDLLRSCYSTKIRPYSDSDNEVEVDWFFCKPDAVVFPGQHCFGSLNWWDGLEAPVGPGEVYGELRPWRDGSADPFYQGQKFCGNLSQFAGGASTSDTPLSVNGDGVPQCCIGLPGGLQIGGQGSFAVRSGGIMLGGEGKFEVRSGGLALGGQGSFWPSQGGLALGGQGSFWPSQGGLALGGDRGPVRRRQKTDAFVTQTGTATINNAWPFATVTGDLLVAVVITSSTGVCTITPPAGWSSIAAITLNNLTMQMFFLPNAAAQTTTGNFVATRAGASIILHLLTAEYFGARTFAVSDHNGNHSGHSATMSSGSITAPFATQELCVCGMADLNRTIGNPSNGWGAIVVNNNHPPCVAMVDYTPANTSIPTANLTLSVAADWVTEWITFFHA